jgi:hypothetical protein
MSGRITLKCVLKKENEIDWIQLSQDMCAGVHGNIFSGSTKGVESDYLSDYQILNRTLLHRVG